MTITVTKRKCPACNCEVGRIKGVLAITYYCRNINCFQTFESKLTKHAKELVK